MNDDRLLPQGSTVRLEFDRATAPLGVDLTGPDTVTGELATLVRVLPSDKTIDADFSFSAFVVEFLVASAAGVLASVLTDLIKKLVQNGAQEHHLKITVEPYPSAPGDQTLRLVVQSASESLIPTPGPAPSPADAETAEPVSGADGR